MLMQCDPLPHPRSPPARSPRWPAEAAGLGAFTEGPMGIAGHIWRKKLPLTAAGVQGLCEAYTRSTEPARALAAEALNLERTLSEPPAQIRAPRIGPFSFPR